MTAGIEVNPGEAQAQRLERVGEQLTTLLHQPQIAQRLSSAPGKNEWSALQTVGHMAEMIPYWLHHCHVLIAATAEPPQFGRALDAPERLAGVERAASGTADELLRLLNDEVQAAARAIRPMSAAERAKQGIHLSRGEMTVAEVIELLIIVHAEDHLAQVRTALQT